VSVGTVAVEGVQVKADVPAILTNPHTERDDEVA
jgi:hypothetical protein